MAEAPKKSSVNSGHRKRMRAAFLNRDINTMPEHEILEILLFYAYPRCDTNKIAHRLINQFGSLQGVFSAPYESLKRVDGVGENAATLIVLFSRLSQKYMFSCFNQREELDEKKLLEFLQNRCKDETEEIVLALFFDRRKRFICMAELTNGTSAETSFKPKTLVNAAILYGASRVILAHNHPNGIPVPSLDDLQATREISHILQLMDIRLDDHIVIAEGECYSMRQSRKHDDIFG